MTGITIAARADGPPEIEELVDVNRARHRAGLAGADERTRTADLLITSESAIDQNSIRVPAFKTSGSLQVPL